MSYREDEKHEELIEVLYDIGSALRRIADELEKEKK